MDESTTGSAVPVRERVDRLELRMANPACTVPGKSSRLTNSHRSSINASTYSGGGGTKAAWQGLKLLPPIQFCLVLIRPAISG
ncbi:hypothetical protein [Kribbella ginsengisoli]|uniref:hypothetical protein n=1 Tax=Kribbella ginsengisoli TaxID=363865 RepID=UPI0031DE50DC